MTALSDKPSHDTVGKPGAVLVVEDDAILRITLAQELRQAGLDVREAGDRAEAEAVLAASGAIDLLVTDIEMPGASDGIELAQGVRQRFPATRIIVVSGTTPEGGVVGVADAFFGKPYDTARLVQWARSFVARRPDGADRRKTR